MTEDTQATLDGAQTGGTVPPPPDSPATTEYVVQVDRTDADVAEHVQMWADVAVVRVPAGTSRKTALHRGLEQAGIEVTLQTRARLLDAEAAYVWTGAPPKTLRLV